MDDASLLFDCQEDWLKWLEENHSSSPGVWLAISKKFSSHRSLSYAEALEAALCYGWIDSQKMKGSGGTWRQRFTPRGERSIWSKINRAKALALIEAGRMQPPGLAAIERAKKNGRWASAYGAFGSAEVPEDLATALRSSDKARAFFELLSSQNRYAILFRLQTAKKPETRAKRLTKFVEMLERGETIYPQESKRKAKPGTLTSHSK